MQVLGRALLVMLFTAGGTAVAAAVPTAAFADCTSHHASGGHGPNGETTGSGHDAEGTTDAEGRICADDGRADPEPAQDDLGS
ncbi:hypothetical protein AB0I81_43135 [Nonomuraea sp. NPDC050404]|uniref:hypothetical protein n=1 Tax=Nonomuraea sp. NPDC050404 TaxID=3155783 RepID=UPI0033E8C3EF